MDLSRERILLTNDDGIYAPGIQLLEKIVRQYTDNVWVVAPADECSGASHSISMHNPVRLREVDNHHFAIKGTPTDCVLMGVHEIMPEPPTLLLSGINWGENLAEDLIYSGTTAAAMEGALLGIRSISFSQVHSYDHVHWDTAERFLPRVLDGVLEAGFDPGTFVNVNFPRVAPDKVKGVRVTGQGLRPAGSFVPERRVDVRTKPYYWIKIAYKKGDEPDGTDLRAVLDSEVSVTPVQLDMTARAMKDRLEAAFTG